MGGRENEGESERETEEARGERGHRMKRLWVEAEIGGSLRLGLGDDK